MESLLHASPNDLHRAARGDQVSRDVWVHIRACPECRDDALSLLLLRRQRRRRRTLAIAASIVVTALAAGVFVTSPHGHAATPADRAVIVGQEPLDPARRLAEGSGDRLTVLEAREIVLLMSLQAMILGATQPTIDQTAAAEMFATGVAKLGEGDAQGAAAAFRGAGEGAKPVAFLGIAAYAAGDPYDFVASCLDRALETLPPAESSSVRVAAQWVRARVAMAQNNPGLARTLLEEIADRDLGGLRSMAAALINEMQ